MTNHPLVQNGAQVSKQISRQTSKSEHKQTGPKTEAGKKVCSKNAQQFGIFTKGYLASENHAQLDLQYQALCQQWGATDPTRQIMVQSMHQAAISANRLALAQQQMIDAAMQSPNVRREFAQLAQIDALTAQNLPAWFFQGVDHPQKATAIYLAAVWDEAKELKDLYSDRLLAEVSTRYPNLYRYVLDGQKPDASFVSAMGLRFKQNVPSQNLVVLMNHLNERYPHHLLWAEDPERFEIYIAGIRGQQLCEGMDLDKSLRYYTAFQNQFNKGCYALDAMSRVEGKGIYAPVLMTNSQLDMQKVHAPTVVGNVASPLVNTQELIDDVVVSQMDVLQNEMPKDN